MTLDKDISINIDSELVPHKEVDNFFNNLIISKELFISNSQLMWDNMNQVSIDEEDLQLEDNDSASEREINDFFNSLIFNDDLSITHNSELVIDKDIDNFLDSLIINKELSTSSIKSEDSVHQAPVIDSNITDTGNHQLETDFKLDYDCKTEVINNTCSNEYDSSFIDRYLDHDLQNKINKTIADLTLDYFLPESSNNNQLSFKCSELDISNIDICKDNGINNLDTISLIDNNNIFTSDNKHYNDNNNITPANEWEDTLDIKANITSDDLAPDTPEDELHLNNKHHDRTPYLPVEESSIETAHCIEELNPRLLLIIMIIMILY